ncbi:molybdate ABC transporter substrate-binding protein [Roseospira navarrensis]|uniref:Molybdate ABC transporter substrate-binding protein n=1 Tax=Roseospira navarrensis TaxID=140058 RepID=A0A7X1ZHW5_9PROT|nr:molybdate ABC transporter substrate-binding protein [Roseospira navarrensis]MQX38269.1 molybdate ABC transporter substrate-binding protein [Roseospira navarrensis]
MTTRTHSPRSGRPFARRALLRALLAGAALTMSAAPALAAEARVAVNAGFAEAAREIGRRFTAQTGHTLAFDVGASGKLYAQIVAGSGADLFLSADVERPVRADLAGLSAPDTRITYAAGRMVLWSADPDRVDDAGAVLTRPGGLPSLAISNPVTSRHGAAAVEVLSSLGVYDDLRPVIVTAADALAVRDMVSDGDVAAGLLPASMVARRPGDGSRWLVPRALHAPIRHQAVLMASGARNAAARSFLAFLREKPARDIILSFDYETPEPPLR